MIARVQRFGSNVNTDYIIAAQHKAASLDVTEMARHTFEDIDPGFADRVRPGDVVVAGANFGCGSSRETAPRVLLACGISAVVAPSYGRIFFRNAINVGLPVIECETDGIDQDDVIEIDLERGQVSIPARGLQRHARPLPDVMRALLDAGGLANYLRLHGDLVLPPGWSAPPNEESENMTQPHEKRRRLRAMLQADRPLVAPGVYDGLTARLVEQSGFDAAIVTGAGVSASLLGAPDVGLMTMPEVLTQTRNIANAVDIAVVGDCDTGYGNPLNVSRTIREFESSGVAGLFIEDQVSPKRCGHFAGKQIIPADEMVQKLRAAADARTDPELILIARTDARATDGIEEAVRRGRLYADAGADMIFVEAPHTHEELEFVGAELGPIGLPLMVNLVEGGRTPLVSVNDLGKLGFSFISFSGSLQKTAIKAMQEMLRALLRDGDVAEFYPSRMISLEERSEILGLPRYFELERRYASSP